MTTNQQFLDRAAYRLGYIEYGASLDATDAADGLNAFNEMMHSWKYSSKDFNWFTQDTLGDTAPIPKWAEAGVIANLGMALSELFSVMPPGQLVAAAREGEKLISRTMITQGMDNADMSHLPQGQGQGYRRDIENDT